MRKVLLVILSVISFQVLAYDGWSAGKVEKIRIQSNRILITQQDASNPGNCPNTDYIYLSQGETAYHKNMISALLTAYATGNKVRLALLGCSGGYPNISEVWVE
ncbi:hypothetical protein [uncultured Photobacterium sp.]|uniref:hypothetical protein n=1 Tax=uncultured Photobacterium sp. TaxID=173973 RepID=UPI002625CD9B|nr:hypothetical protein [uncultured Photobacterium sp.]